MLLLLKIVSICIAYKLGWSSGLKECHKVKQVATHIHQPTKYLNNNLIMGSKHLSVNQLLVTRINQPLY